MEVKVVSARIKEIIPRTYNIKSFRLKVKEDVDFKAGQFLYVMLGVEKEAELSRYLSISNSPTEKGYIEFTKRISGSRFSARLQGLNPGDVVRIRYPLGNFVLREDCQRIAFLSSGIGITPIRSICKYVVDLNLDIDIVLIYGNRTRKDIAFKDDFDIMEEVYPKLKVIYVLSDTCGDWPGRKGYIGRSIIEEEVPDYRERVFYLCGPPLMVESLRKILWKLDLSNERVITEDFIGY